MKYMLYVMAFLAMSLSCLAQNQRPPGTKFYVLAHPEQLQLYMANDAARDILAAKDSLRHMVFIYVTSGEHKETGAQKRAYDYQINEAAARSAIEIIANTYQCDKRSQRMWMSDWEADKPRFNGHRVLQYKSKNITCYFLRLPTSANNSGGQQSLEQLYEGRTMQISTPDSSTAYDNWEDLVKTVREIICSESNAQYVPWLNTVTEEGSNSTETMLNKYVSLLATEAFTGLPKYGMSSYFKHSKTDLLPANMPAEYIVMQAAMMAAYDFTRTCKGEPSNWESSMVSKAGRTYKSLVR